MPSSCSWTGCARDPDSPSDTRAGWSPSVQVGVVDVLELPCLGWQLGILLQSLLHCFHHLLGDLGILSRSSLPQRHSEWHSQQHSRWRRLWLLKQMSQGGKLIPDSLSDCVKVMGYLPQSLVPNCIALYLCSIFSIMTMCFSMYVTTVSNIVVCMEFKESTHFCVWGGLLAWQHTMCISTQTKVNV